MLLAALSLTGLVGLMLSSGVLDMPFLLLALTPLALGLCAYLRQR